MTHRDKDWEHKGKDSNHTGWGNSMNILNTFAMFKVWNLNKAYIAIQLRPFFFKFDFYVAIALYHPNKLVKNLIVINHNSHFPPQKILMEFTEI